jgi:hypothetical protein
LVVCDKKNERRRFFYENVFIVFFFPFPRPKQKHWKVDCKIKQQRGRTEKQQGYTGRSFA